MVICIGGGGQGGRRNDEEDRGDLDCISFDSVTTIGSPFCALRLFVVFDLYLGGLVALALAVYLGYALLHPEKF